MAYCSYCGVELDEDMDSCPLCGNAKSENITDIRIQLKDALKTDTDKVERGGLTKWEKRKLFWELSVIILFAGCCVSLLIDLITSKSITWSRFSASTSLAIIIHLNLFYFLRNRLYILLSGSFLTNSLLLLLYDSYTFHLGWGMLIGIPILLFIYISIIGLTIVMRYIQDQGLNLIAFFFIAIGIVCFGIESILDLYIREEIHTDWSLYVLVTLVPIALVLLFFHYRLKKGRRLRRLFHI